MLITILRFFVLFIFFFSVFVDVETILRNHVVVFTAADPAVTKRCCD